MTIKQQFKEFLYSNNPELARNFADIISIKVDKNTVKLHIHIFGGSRTNIVFLNELNTIFKEFMAKELSQYDFLPLIIDSSKTMGFSGEMGPTSE